MSDLQLVIGNKNYSSWSLRAWLALRKSGADFEEILLPLDTPEFAVEIAQYSPSGRVPVLWHEGQCIWDSLAIAEYANEQFADGGLWPEDSYSRAMGRSLAAEMHSGFFALRNELPMNIRARRRVEGTPALQADLERLFVLWGDSLSCHADVGPWLLGQFSIADAMFAPVVMRLLGYGIEVPEDIQPYVALVDTDVDMAQWKEAALAETWIVDADEAGVALD